MPAKSPTLKNAPSRWLLTAAAVAAAPAAFLLFSPRAANSLFSLSIPSAGEMLRWFFFSGGDISPSSVQETLADNPLLVAIYLAAAACAVALLVAAFRLILPRGKEAEFVNWNITTVIFTAAFLFLLWQFVGAIAFNIFSAFMPGGAGAEDAGGVAANRAGAVGTVVASACVLTVLVALVKGLFRGSALDLGLHRKGAAGAALKGAILLALLLPATRVAGQVSTFFLSATGAEPESQGIVLGFAAEPSAWFVAFYVFVAVVVAPIWEETFFRGFLLQGFKRALGGDVAIILTAGLFALAHADTFWVWPPIFALGLMLGYAFDRTRSLWVAIGMHAAFNAFTMAFLILAKYGKI